MPFTLPAQIDDVAQQSKTYQPLLLAKFIALDGAILRVSTHTNAFGSNTYVARVLNMDASAMQELSSQGLDTLPDFNIALADADGGMSSWDKAHGFLGAEVFLELIFWDVGTSNYSNDSYQAFFGKCDLPEITDLQLSVRATSILNLESKTLPMVPIQPLCPWIFPETAAQKALANTPGSLFYECGVTNPLLTSCTYTVAACAANANSRRYGGIQWQVPPGGKSREYVSGKIVDVVNYTNGARYGDWMPIVYGTAWVDTIVYNSLADGNSTRGHALICYGQVSDIYKVVLGNELLPAANTISGSSLIVKDYLFQYSFINSGNRDGNFDMGPLIDGKSDPYGSQTVIAWCYPKKDVGIPSIRALVKGRPVRVYTDQTTFTTVYSENPIWCMIDILCFLCGIDYQRINMTKAIAAAAFCDVPIPYVDPAGTSGTRARYSISTVIRQRRSAADIFTCIRRSCNGMVLWSGTTGQIEFYIRQTLADQQPGTISGSNWNFASLPSKRADGTSQNGYLAYNFAEGNILANSDDTSSLRRVSRALAQTPTSVSIGFANRDRDYSGDVTRIVDPVMTAIVGQDVTPTIKADGIQSLEVAQRIGATTLAESQADIWEWLTTFQGAKLRVGQIIALNSIKYSMVAQYMRIQKLKPTTNMVQVAVTAAIHNDDWYLDTYGLFEQQAIGDSRRNRLARPSYPWCPFEVQPVVGDAVFLRSEWTFGLQVIYDYGREGAPQPSLAIRGRSPVNDPSPLQAPIIGRQGTTATTGGTFPGGGWTFYLFLSAVDVDGRPSGLSDVCIVVVLGVGDLHTVTIPVISWPAGTVGYEVFGGKTPAQIHTLKTGSGTPSSITVADWFERTLGPPDPEADELRGYVKIVEHGGPWGASAGAVTSTTIQIPGAAFSTNDYANREVLLVAKADGTEVPHVCFAISANTADVLTVSPNPVGLVQTADVLILLMKPSIAGMVLTDPLWLNNLSNGGAGLVPGEEKGRIFRWIAGPGEGETYPIANNGTTSITIEGDWITPPTSASRGIIEQAAWLPEEGVIELPNNRDESATLELRIPVRNYAGKTLLIEPTTADGGDNEPVEKLCQARLVYVIGKPGATGTLGLDGYQLLTIVANAVTSDLALGLNLEVILISATQITVNNPVNTSRAIVAGDWFSLRVKQDATGHWPTPAFDTEFEGVAAIQIGGEPSTYSELQFTRTAAGKWALGPAQIGVS